VVLASVLLFLTSLLWAAIVPGFQTPDELQHLNSVVRLADGGGWPAPGDPVVEDEMLKARALAGASTHGRRTVLPGETAAMAPGTQSFDDLSPTGVGDRPSLHTLDAGPTTRGPVDQMTQHPPGYYAVAAVVYRLLDLGDRRFDRAMFVLRALTALMVAATVPVCCFLAGRELSGKSSIGQVAAFVPLLIPQLHYISAGITNDGAAIATTAVMWASLITITCSGPTRRRLLVLALAVGAACLTKGTAVALLPTVPVGLAVAYRRSIGGSVRQWGRAALLAASGVGGLAFALGGWWWALNLLRYGRLQPSGLTVSPGGTYELMNPFQFGVAFVARMRWTFFAEIGRREHPSLRLLTITLAVVFAGTVVAGLLSRGRLGERLMMLTGVGASVGVLFATTYSAHLQTNRMPGIQGRYLFVLIVPVAVLFAVGMARLGERVRIPQAWQAPAVAGAGVLVAAAGMGLGFRIFYAVPGRPPLEALSRFLGWAVWSPMVLGALLAAFVGAAVALVVVAIRAGTASPGPLLPVPLSLAAERSVLAPSGRPVIPAQRSRASVMERVRPLTAYGLRIARERLAQEAVPVPPASAAVVAGPANVESTLEGAGAPVG
jgi:hypothetical protein